MLNKLNLVPAARVAQMRMQCATLHPLKEPFACITIGAIEAKKGAWPWVGLVVVSFV